MLMRASRRKRVILACLVLVDFLPVMPNVTRDRDTPTLQAGNAQTVMAASAAVGQPKPRAARPAADAADRKRTRVDFDTIFQDVTALGASAFTGKDKKQWEAKRLAAAGAALAPRKEKMPLRMAIGVTKVCSSRAAYDDVDACAYCSRQTHQYISTISGHTSRRAHPRVYVGAKTASGCCS